jgi:hypothetical protein
MVDKLKIYLLNWYFQHNHCLNIIKNDVHNIHRLAWGPYVYNQLNVPLKCIQPTERSFKMYKIR